MPQHHCHRAEPPCEATPCKQGGGAAPHLRLGLRQGLVVVEAQAAVLGAHNDKAGAAAGWVGWGWGWGGVGVGVGVVGVGLGFGWFGLG